MEENNAKIGKVIAIIFAVLIGLAVIFVMVVKDKEGGDSSSSLSKEQVYDKNGLSFTYPAGYIMTSDNYEDGVVDVTCEVKGSELGQIEISYASMEEFKLLSDDDKNDLCRSTLQTMTTDLRNKLPFGEVSFDPITTGYIGDRLGYQMDYYLTILSVKSQGTAKIAVTEEGQMLVIVTLYENHDYKKTLDKIENSIKLQ